MELETMLGMFFFGSLALILLLAGVALVGYIFQALALSRLAKREGLDYEWLAWVPVFSVFLMTMLVEDDVHESLRGKYTITYAIVAVVSALLSSVISFIVMIPAIMVYYAFYLIAEKYSKNAILHIILAVITFGLSVPFQLFRFRNREPVGASGTLAG